MAIDANDAVTNPNRSTGPKTDAGKTRSSRNAVQHGLFSKHDLIRQAETGEYLRVLTSLTDQFNPEGVLEETFVNEIVGATWRLRRCCKVEDVLISRSTDDPMIDELTAKHQKSVDRARAQSHTVLRRSMAELRRLQSERAIPAPQSGAGERQDSGMDMDMDMDGFGLMSSLADKSLAQDFRERGLAAFRIDHEFPAMPEVPAPQAPVVEPAPVTAAPAAPEPEPSSFCETAPSQPPTVDKWSKVPRNAPCPCGSGAKFKKCCLNPAAKDTPIAA